MLDKSKDYGTVYNDKNGIRFEQNGRFFYHDGSEAKIPTPEEMANATSGTVEPVLAPEPVPEPKINSKPIELKETPQLPMVIPQLTEQPPMTKQEILKALKRMKVAGRTVGFYKATMTRDNLDTILGEAIDVESE